MTKNSKSRKISDLLKKNNINTVTEEITVRGLKEVDGKLVERVYKVSETLRKKEENE